MTTRTRSQIKKTNIGQTGIGKKKIQNNKTKITKSKSQYQRPTRTHNAEEIFESEDIIETMATLDGKPYEEIIIILKNEINKIAEKYNINNLKTINENLFEMFEKLSEQNCDQNNIETNYTVSELEEKCKFLESNLKKEKDNTETLIETFEIQETDYKEEIKNLKKMIKIKEKELAQIKEDRNHYTNEIQESQSKLQEMKNEKQEISDKLVKVMAENEDMRITMEVFKNTLEDMKYLNLNKRQYTNLYENEFKYVN